MASKITSAEIKKIIKSGNVVLGTEKSLKSLKLGNVQKVLMSSNCPANVEKDINYYSGMGSVEVHKLGFPNDEIGVICKKPFSISVLAVLKQQNSANPR